MSPVLPRILAPLLLASALLAAGCGVSRLEERPSSDAAVFPHGEGFDAGAEHGRRYLDVGAGSCAGCHDLQAEEAGEAAATGTPPACRDCHSTYPHETGWRAGAAHGAGLAGAEADRSDCLACHEAEGFVATDSHGCTSCHRSYPHATGWAGAGEHGLYALGSPDSSVVCGSCHGSGLEGSTSAPGCSDCHESWPHPSGWSDPGAHGGPAQADLAQCAGCHATGASWDGGPVGVACARCHATYPHGADWREGHLPAALLVSEAICLRCHEAGDGPATMVATCARQCHGGGE